MLLKDIIEISKRNGAMRRQYIPHIFFDDNHKLISDIISEHNTERMCIIYRLYLNKAEELNIEPIPRSSFYIYISKLENIGEIELIRIRNKFIRGGWEVRVYKKEDK